MEQDAIHIWKHLKLKMKKLRNPSSLLPLAHNPSYKGSTKHFDPVGQEKN